MKPIRSLRRGHAGLLGAVAVLLLGLTWGVAGAWAAGSSASPGGQKSVVRFGFTATPDGFNPFTAATSASYEILNLNYDMLTKFDAATWQPAPSLAESWDVSNAGRVWTFHLVRNAKWQDGKPLTAADVAFTYNYIIKNQMGAFTSYTEFIEKAVAVDPYTVQLICSQPKANMLGLWVPILPEHLWKDIDPKLAGSSYQNPLPIIGSGPFKVAEYKRSDFVRLVANKDYFRGAPKVDELIFQTYQSQDAMTQDMKSGNLAACWNIPEAQFKPLGKVRGVTTVAYTPLSFDQICLNCYAGAESRGHPALRDTAFRRALAYAVDTQKVVDIVYAGYAMPGTTIIQPNHYKDPDWHWQPPADVAYTYDPARAKAALDAAGYKDTNGDGTRDYKGKPITLRLWALTTYPPSQKAAKLVAGWFRAIGLGIKLEAVEEATLQERTYDTVGKGADAKLAPDFDMFIWGWNPDIDPNFILGSFTTSQIGYWSDSAYSNPEYDRLFKEQQRTIDRQARKLIIDQMQQIIYRDCPYVVLAYPESLEAYNTDKWTGWVRSPAKTGGVWYLTEIDQYRFLEPRTGR